MPPILDVAIGLLFVYLLFSLVVTAARELCAAFTNSSWDKRARLLKQGIGEMFGDQNVTNGFSEKFFAHPLIKALSPNKENAQPNYIPREIFVSTVLDLIAKPDPAAPRSSAQIFAGVFGPDKSNLIAGAKNALDDLAKKYPNNANITACFKALASATDYSAQRGNFPTALGSLTTQIAFEIRNADAALTAARDNAAAHPNQTTADALRDAQAAHDVCMRALSAHQKQIETVEYLLRQFDSVLPVSAIPLDDGLRTTLLALYEDSGRDIEEFKKHLGAWFDRSMERVTGWYKKYTQRFILALGLVLAVAWNVDSLHIIDALSTDSALREQIVKSATEYVNASPSLGKKAVDAEAHAKRAREDAEKESDLTKKTNALTAAAVLENEAKAARTAWNAEIAKATNDLGNIEKIENQATNDVNKAKQAASNDPGNAVLASNLKEAETKAIKPVGDANAAREKLKKLISTGSAEVTTQLKNAVREMNGFGLPIGWQKGEWEKKWRDFPSGLSAILGWILTALAASLGAPFWFDMLNKIVTIRAGGRAPEEKNPGENGGKS
jgi:hypothetical protein